MSEMMFVVWFAMIVLLPCVVAAVAMHERGWRFADLDGHHTSAPRALGRRSIGFPAQEAERPVTELFVIRSFPKGLSAKRSKLIQDGIAPAIAAITVEPMLIDAFSLAALPSVATYAASFAAETLALPVAEAPPTYYGVPLARPAPQRWHEVFDEPAAEAPRSTRARP